MRTQNFRESNPPPPSLLRLINGGQNGAIVITNAVLSHNGRKLWVRCGGGHTTTCLLRSGGRLCASWRGRSRMRHPSDQSIRLKSVSLFFGFWKVTPTPRNQRENDAGFPNAMDTMILELALFADAAPSQIPNQNYQIPSLSVRVRIRPAATLRRTVNE